MLSRVADTLYWLARYIERAENNARILDVNLQVTLDDENSGVDGDKVDWEPILATLEDQKLFSKLYAVTNAETVCEFVTFAKENPNSIRSSVGAARENARTVREYISSEMWERINSLYLWMNGAQARQLFAASAIDFFRHVVDCSHQFQGTTAATLTHGEGWHFLQIGKYLERADSTSRILDLKYHILLPRGEEVGGNVDTVQWQAVLKSCSAFEAYRKLHTGQVTPLERRRVHHPARQLPALDPVLRRGGRRRAAPHLGLRPRPLHQRCRAPLRQVLLRSQLRQDRRYFQNGPAPVPRWHPAPAH